MLQVGTSGSGPALVELFPFSKLKTKFSQILTPYIPSLFGILNSLTITGRLSTALI